MDKGYTAEAIRVLNGLEPVRVRPGMYIGSTDERGLHHCVYEVIDNCVDEAMAGYCTEIEVELQKDGGCRVTDNGRGIPVGIMKEEGISAVEVVLTKLHAGGKFGEGGYEISGGLHGVGVSCVNALSERLEVEVAQNEELWKMTFSRGIPQNHLTKICKTSRRGTTIVFYPDPEIFEVLEFNYNTLRQRIQELAFLNKGLKFHFKDSRDLKEQEETFLYNGGIVEYIELINQKEKELEEKERKEVELGERKEDDFRPRLSPRQPLYFTDKGTFKYHDKIIKYELEISLQYNGGYSEQILTFANNIRTNEGGHHLEGFKAALYKVIKKYAIEGKFLKENEELKSEDCREGLVAVVSVKLENPQFEGQTKTKLGTPAIRGVVAEAVENKFGELLEENKDIRISIIAKALNAKKGREAAERAKKAVRKGVLEFSGLPGKLADCTSDDPTECEIYLVEGDSAGGTAKTGRDRRFQAIMPLRGKILNVEKASIGRALESEEIKNMITAFGCGIDQFDDTGRPISKCDVSKLKYDKIISMTDADVDGAHIRILLITFIYKFMRPVIEQGHLYAAQPPLYKVTKKVGSREEKYFYDDKSLNEYLDSIDRKGEIQRYKGLGEMDKEQLWETTMDPERRTLVRITMEDAERASEKIRVLMGDEPELRRQFIEENANLVKDLDI